MSLRKLSACLLAALAGVAPARPAAAAPPGGIYAIVDASAPAQDGVTAQALQNPGVAGLLIHLRWNDISTAKEQYDWRSLDRVVKLATDAHKNFQIGMVTGAALPGWITDPPPAGLGARHGTFHYNAVSGGGCANFIMAAPWDVAYLAAFRNFLRQLAQHLRETHSYAALSMLKLDGIGTTTDELRLPALDECGGKTIATWQRLHYTPAKVENAWATMLQDYLDLYPDKSFDIGFIGINAFPGIKADGSAAASSTAAKALSAQLAATLIADAGRAMPGRLGLGFDSLTLTLPATDKSYGQSKRAYFAAAAAAGARLGWQTNELLGNYPKDGAACGLGSDGKGIACTGSPQFLQMLLAGIYPEGEAATPAGEQGAYLELFPQNIVAFPAAVRTASRHLAAWQ